MERPETADEYGRRSDCFKDHRRRPFQFRYSAPLIRDSALEPAPDGLIHQPGLTRCSLPWPAASLETLVDRREDIPDYGGCGSPVSSSRDRWLKPRPERITNLCFDVGELDLGSVPEADMQHVFEDVSSQQHCHFATTWLPLTPVEPERDEGLVFPRQSSKLYSLLCRELETEKIASPDETEKRVDVVAHHDGHRPQLAAAFPPFFRRCHVDVVTPPLSPISEPDSPFVPSLEVAVIDLTSEPSTPSLRNDYEAESPVTDFPGSDLAASTPTAFLSPPRLGKEATRRHSAARDAALDVPLVVTDSDSIQDIDLPANLGHAASPSPIDVDGSWSTELTAISADSAVDPARLVEQEQLNPVDSIARVPVPVMDFQVARPSWLHQAWSAREHFLQLQADSATTFQLPMLSKDIQLDGSLNWSVTCHGNTTFSPVDQSELVEEASYSLTGEQLLPSPQSARFICHFRDLAILELKGDLVIQETDLDEPGDNQDSIGNVEKEITHACLPHDGAWGERVCPGRAKPQTSRRIPTSTKFDFGDALLPISTDSSATTTLLAGFMELRAVKRPRLATSDDCGLGNAATASPAFSTSVPPQLSLPEEPAPLATPAPVPKYEIPDNKGPCIVSLTLERSVIGHLEKSWPSDLIFDRDYSRHSTQPGVAASSNLVALLGFEADISLSPRTGVIVTTLAKAKQKPLPGTNVQTPLRERIQKTSMKYEKLIVLVSEANQAGEYVGSQGPSDMAAYADFVRFAASLDALVVPYLVPGATKTLSEWLLFLLCQQSSESTTRGAFVSSTESSWDVFLRLAGLNVFAAQVLSQTLMREFGNMGLAQFLSMPTHVKVTKYGQLIGGERALIKSGELLDRGWS